jgi:hypothetical protein
MDELLVAKLIADDTLTALVADRIDPVMPDEDTTTFPYLYYWRVDTQDTFVLNGPIRPKQYTYAIDYWSRTQTECRAIADAVYAILGTWRDENVQGCFQQSDGMQEEGEPLLFHGQQTYLIWS